jgi:hypothetical protein
LRDGFPLYGVLRILFRNLMLHLRGMAHRAHDLTNPPEFYRAQSAICRAVARRNVSPIHRATFIRLAWHWRRVARAADVRFAMT